MTREELVESIKSNIDDQLSTVSGEVGLEASRAWLEGWICGVTDPIIHPRPNTPLIMGTDEERGVHDDTMEYLKEKCEEVRSRISRALKAYYSEEREMVVVKRDDQELLYIEEFQDESHPGHHLFLSPVEGANISTSLPDVPWTHELLMDR